MAAVAANLKASSNEVKMLEYLERRGVKSSSATEYVRIWRRVGPKILEVQSLEAIPALLETHFQELMAEGASTVTIRNQRTACRYYFKALGFNDLLKNVKLPGKLTKTLTKSLLDHEVEAVLKALAAKNKRAALAFEIILLTGMRLSELIGCRFKESELSARRVLVPTTSGQRMVFVGQKAAGLMRKLKNSRRWPRGESSRVALNKLLKETSDALGLKDVSSSRLRITFAVRMMLADHPIDFVAKNLGLDAKASYESRRRLRRVLVDHTEREKAHRATS